LAVITRTGKGTQSAYLKCWPGLLAAIARLLTLQSSDMNSGSASAKFYSSCINRTVSPSVASFAIRYAVGMEVHYFVSDFSDFGQALDNKRPIQV